MAPITVRNSTSCTMTGVSTVTTATSSNDEYYTSNISGTADVSTNSSNDGITRTMSFTATAEIQVVVLVEDMIVVITETEKLFIVKESIPRINESIGTSIQINAPPSMLISHLFSRLTSLIFQKPHHIYNQLNQNIISRCG